ncbi:MAG: DUF2484 family protein [Defluviimonas denitrificans]
MSLPVVLSCLWVLAAALVALLPMRRQFAPGFVLLAMVPVLIVWLAVTYGVWAGVAILAVFISMFRRPLIYFAKRAMGRVPPRPSGDDGA